MEYCVVFKEKAYVDRTLSVTVDTDSKENIERLIKEKSFSGIIDIDETDISSEFVKIESIKEME